MKWALSFTHTVSMKDSKHADREVFESIPWEELRDLGEASGRRKIWYLIAGAAVVAVLVFSVARTFSAPDPRIAVAATPAATLTDPSSPVSTGSPPPPSSLDVLSEVPAIMTEADLKAGEEEIREKDGLKGWQAASFSEWFVVEFFTLDGSDHHPPLGRWLRGATAAEPSDALSHVEWSRALEVEPLADGRWRAVVGMRRIVSQDGADYRRLPTQGVEVVVDLGAGTPAIVDTPRFVPLPETAAAQWWMGEPWETPPPAVIRAARDEMMRSDAGTVEGEPKVTRTGEAWRVEWAIVDPAGISWPVSLWFGPEGMPIPAGG